MEQSKEAAVSDAEVSPTAQQNGRDGGTLLLERALLPDGWADNVEIRWGADGLLTHVQTRSTAAGQTIVPGSAVPGMANAHSHAHQRLMVGLAERAESKDDSFWSWREVMYSFAERLHPEQLQAVAAQAYVEMLECGFTAVGEFQYLHNQRGGRPYDQRAEMSERCLQAARDTGIAITLLPVLYTRAGFEGGELSSGQKRFAAGVDQICDIVARLGRAMGIASRERLERERVGCAPHSLRAVSTADLLAVVEQVHSTGPAPVHLHIAEQQREVDACIAATGVRPVELLIREAVAKNHPLDSSWSLIHATHASVEELTSVAELGATVVLCPTTEANLGDGIFPAPSFHSEGGQDGSMAIGSDSQVRISVAEELRELELGQRLRDGKRSVLGGGKGAPASTGRSLFDRCATGGAASLQQPMGSLSVGQRADLVVLDANHPRLLGRSRDSILDSWIFAGDNRCVREVFVGGERLVEEGRHVAADKVHAAFKAVVKDLGS